MRPRSDRPTDAEAAQRASCADLLSLTAQRLIRWRACDHELPTRTRNQLRRGDRP